MTPHNRRLSFARGIAAALPPLFTVMATIAVAVIVAVSIHGAEPTGPLREGQDWPQFLGPHGTGVSDAVGLLEKWPADGPPVVWKRSVGVGYSAPSVRDGRLVLFRRLGDEEVVECLDAVTGKTLWKTGYKSAFEDPYGYNNGPRCTPLLTKNRCYTYGAEAKLLCTDLQTGEQLWLRDLKAEFDLPQWFFGVGCTPILEDGKLIVLVGGQPNSGVVAFDPATGKTLWQSVGKDTWDGVETGFAPGDTYEWTGEEQIASYSSPIAVTIHGQRHLLCLLRHGLVSLDPKDGSLRFKYWFRSRARESVNAARPVVIGDRILLSAAYRVGSVLLEVAEDGKSVTEVWRDPQNLLAHWTTPIAVDGFAYGFTGRHEHQGEFRCIDLKTGEVQWATTGYAGEITDLPPLALNRRTGQMVNLDTGESITPPFFGRGSLIRVGDRFIILGEYGTLALAKVNPKKYEEISRAYYPEIHTPAWAAPVLARGRLYLQCEDGLICLDLRKQP